MESVPRLSLGGRFVVVSPHEDRWAREEFIGATFGSMDRLWEGDAFEDRTPGSAVEAFREVLAEFLDLFAEAGIGMMQDGDPALLVRLEALLARLSALPADPRHDAMRRWILQVREDWYAIAG